MKLERVTIENYRAIEKLDLPLDPDLTVFHGTNGRGKTSVLSAIAAGLGSILAFFPGVRGSNIRSLKTDKHGQRSPRVRLRTRDGIEWEKPMPDKGKPPIPLKESIDEIIAADREGAELLDLPIVAFYDTDRAVFDSPQRRNPKKGSPRYAVLEGALSPRTNFREFFRWFYARENEELRGKNERRDFDYRLKDLDAVRKAIERMVPGISDPRIKSAPLRFVVSMEWEELALDQLGGGYRMVLALAADLARRMVQGNPHLNDPLGSEAVVLIDEVDLHLHPEWQQRILVDLRRTFPNTQFIVSTHSPQVLTTVHPQHVIHLHRKNARIVAGQPSAPTYGAEAGSVLEAVMGVRERPAAEHNEFVKKLDTYMRLVDDGRGRSREAKALRKELEILSARDSALDAADMEMERQEIFKRMENVS